MSDRFSEFDSQAIGAIADNTWDLRQCSVAHLAALPTKRELFAAMALQGLVQDYACAKAAAKCAVAFADALIAELAKEATP